METTHDCSRSVGLFMLAATLVVGSAAAKADAVLDWNEIAVNTAIANGQNPFAQARTAAIVQLAVFEAVNAIRGDYQPYLGTIVTPHGASADAAAIEAAYHVLITYFPGSAATLNPALMNSLASIPDGQPKTDGIATGDAAALAMIAVRANDGSSPPQFKVPGPAVPGEYQATPSCPIVNGVAVGAFFHWQNVTPFGIQRASDFLLGPPPALTSNAYAKTYNEVMTVGSADSTERPQDRADVVHYYAAASPTQVFNQAARQVAQEQMRSLSENARALALINMAINDSLVASFFNKYHYNFWRPRWHARVFQRRAGLSLQIAQVAATGGESAVIASNLPNPHLSGISPDGAMLTATSANYDEPTAAVWGIPLPAGLPRRIGDLFAQNAVPLRDGRLLFVREAQMYLASKDGSDIRKLADFSDRFVEL